MSNEEKKFEECGVFSTLFNSRSIASHIRGATPLQDAQYARLLDDKGELGHTSVRFENAAELAEHMKANGNKVTLEDGSVRKFGLVGNLISNQDLSGAQCMDMPMSNVTFDACNLDGTNFGWAKLEHGMNFTNCSMEGTSFKGAKGRDCNVSMDFSEINNAEFGNAEFNNLSLRNANVDHTNFTFMEIHGYVENEGATYGNKCAGLTGLNNKAINSMAGQLGHEIKDKAADLAGKTAEMVDKIPEGSSRSKSSMSSAHAYYTHKSTIGRF